MSAEYKKFLGKKVLFWYRKDLRCEDHPLPLILNYTQNVEAIYIHEEKYDKSHLLGFPWIGEKRKTFLAETLIDLKKKLTILGINLQIYTKVEDVIASNNFSDTILVYQELLGSEELLAEKKLKSFFASHNITTFKHFTLIDLMKLPFRLNEMPIIFTKFRQKVELADCFSAPISIPKLDHISVDFNFSGGENQGLQRVLSYIFDKKLIQTYKETRNGLLGFDFSTRFSPYLAIGALSAQTIYYFVKQYEKEWGSNESTYWVIFELLWRDFFQFQLALYGNGFFQVGGIQKKERSFQNNERIFQKWCEGNTNDDFVNAAMRELKLTGWMSNRARQNVASYLIHDLCINWTWGAAWFESQLIDYDVASNWGNWMYIAGLGNDARPFRKFNTQKQATAYDPNFLYRKHYLK
jgi:deoxyribodipyrimidine photo-lyase